MKVVAYVALHYGAEWLEWALSSVHDVVDETIVVYSEKPSYSYSTPIPCPETRNQLFGISMPYVSEWYDVMGMLPNEGAHRNLALEYCRYNHNADLVVVLDADEVWDPLHLSELIGEVTNADKPVRNWRVAFRHFWRSVNYVCYDPAMPVRIIDLTEPNNATDGYLGDEFGYVNHFGYAQSPKIMKYKWRIHGHLPELRPNWFDGTFMPWQPGQGDVHPTCAEGFWNPESFDRNELYYLIGEHPYFHDGIIT